jgi:hypothetical protein
MIILTERKKTREKSGWLIHVKLGEVGFAIDAPTKDEAIRIALERAWAMVSRGACSINIPKIIRVNGESYQAPPDSVRIANHID